MRRFLSAVGGALLFRLPFWIIAYWTLPTFCNWDCGIYSDISQHYTAANAAFFPLFPLLVHGASRALPFLSRQASVLFVSNLFVPLAGALFLFLTDELWSDGGSGGGGGAEKRIAGFLPRSWFALLLLSVFPEGHFWMRGYSEPVFFALLMAILLGLRPKSPSSARSAGWLLVVVGACGGLIAVTRPQGVWVDGVVGVYLLYRLFAKGGRNGKSIGPLVAAILLCGLPFLGFMAWLWAKTGNPLYFYAAQHGWGRQFDFLAGLKSQLPRWDASHLYLYLGVWAAWRFFRRPNTQWRILGVLSLLFSELPIFFGGFFSYVRFASVNPALFLLGAELVIRADRPTGPAMVQPSGRAARWATPGIAIAVIVWCIVRLALQIHLAGNGWVG